MISAWKGSQSSLSKAFRFNTKPKTSTGTTEKTFGNSTSPTPSYSSSESGGVYAILGRDIYPSASGLPPPTSAPPPPPSHRVSAPPGNNIGEYLDTSPLDQQHRRVKSISDIEAVAAPV